MLGCAIFIPDMATKPKQEQQKAESPITHVGTVQPHRPLTEAERLEAQRRVGRKLDLLFGCVHPSLKDQYEK